MNKHDENWFRMYELAKVYFLKYGNLEVLSNFKTINGYEYDASGVSLGMWIAKQRQLCNPLSERGRLLSFIGMRFSKIKSTLTWDEMYQFAKSYFLRHGNLEVPQRFKTNDGYTYDVNGCINLGSWINTQRHFCDSSSERGSLLLLIGMRFERKYMKSKFSWKEMYEYAKVYFLNHGNLQIPSNFKTSNGYEYDTNGCINLGSWINTQRHFCDPLSERGYLLNCIGMIWDVKKNKFDILCSCYDNNIDVEKNRFVLKHISFVEFNVKMSFLNENCISVVDSNGFLHEIFSMSSMDIKLKYGLGLDDLVKIYNKSNIY